MTPYCVTLGKTKIQINVEARPVSGDVSVYIAEASVVEDARHSLRGICHEKRRVETNSSELAASVERMVVLLEKEFGERIGQAAPCAAMKGPQFEGEAWELGPQAGDAG